MEIDPSVRHFISVRPFPGIENQRVTGNNALFVRNRARQREGLPNPKTESEVNQRLEEKIVRGFHSVHEIAREHRIDNRAAALVLAVGRVAKALELQGTWP